jgi:von Willebrand factor type A domain
MRLLRQWTTCSLLVALLSCGGSEKESTFGNTSGGTSATGGGAGGAAGKGSILDGGGIITTGGGGGGGGAGGFGGSGLGEDAKVCGGIEVAVETQPFNMLIMFDQSISMNEFLNGTSPPTRWEAVTGAVIQFFQSADAQLLSIGLAYFEQIDPTTSATSCRVQDYSTPEVEIAPVDATQSQKLIDSMKKHYPTGFTPTAPALQGALDHAKAYTMAHPGPKTIVVLATDGIPTQCMPNGSYDIGQMIAGPAFMGTPSIRTFVIAAGSSSSLMSLSAIASAGGTGQPVFVSDDPSKTTDQIKSAFQRLGRTNFSCSYKIPAGGEGGRTDPSQINVVIRTGTGGDRRLPLFSTSTNCGDGWYYDNPGKPENIMLCPQTCSSLFNGELRIVVGCASPPPM